ncbi:hypothetical protein [Okeania sp. KiyG1]|uniref:hypothetical protein n=1 Tax=Okeania sp. KiyG1 TaxID=2720165 RepID=UPI001924D2B8|nr:hypothetical protein [Okeania sp. KiyG1]GGA39686.1 hypothetical protein CYANOKiyG1_57880 [Okeania sp. KiyG1]
MKQSTTGPTHLKWCIIWGVWGGWEVWEGWGEKDIYKQKINCTILDETVHYYKLENRTRAA